MSGPAPELREVRMDGAAVIAQVVALRAMADAMAAVATNLLTALGAEPTAEAPVVGSAEEINAPPRFGRTR